MAEYTFELATVEPTITYAPTPVIDVGANSLDCLVSKQTGPIYENITGATYQYTSQIPGLPYLPAASLATCPLWLVFYECSFGGGPLTFGGAAIPQIEVMSNRGGINPPNSDKTYGGGEGSGITVRTPESSRCHWMGGCFLFAPDGTDLEFRLRTTAGTSFKTYYSGMSLTALPVDVSPNPKRLHYAPGGDLSGIQMALTGDPTITVPSGTSWAPILTTTQSLAAGNYLVIASCQGDTILNNGIQMGFLVDGEVQKTATTRIVDNNRDDVPFFYASVHAFGAGTHNLTLEGGHNAGPDNKIFRKARIWLINLNNFERYAWTKGDPEMSIGDIQFPNWNTTSDLQLTLTPFSQTGEYLLSLGTSFADRTTQAGILTRIFNATQGNAAHEFSAAAQVKLGGNDVSCLGTVGCELANVTTTYQLQHCGSTGVSAGDIDIRYRELVVIGLTKKAGQAPPSVSITVSDSCTTNETQSTPTSGIGVSQLFDSCGTADFLSMIGEAPPAGIPNMHPRLISQAKIARLRAQAGYDNNGNIIGSPSAEWTEMLADLVGDPSIFALWGHVIKWVVTQSAGDLATAKSKIATAFNSDVSFLGGGPGGALQYSGLTSGRWVRQACLFYDLLYHELTTAQRTMMQEYIMGICYATLNNSGKGTPGVIYNPLDETWSQNDPSNNYFVNFHQNSMYAAITLYHDVWPTNPSPSFAWPPGSGTGIRSFWLPFKKAQASGETYTDMWEYVNDRMQQMAIPVWDQAKAGGVIGGGWHEGGHYRPMWAMVETFRLFEEIGGATAIVTNLDLRDFAYYAMHATMPRHKRAPETGDSAPGEKRKHVGPNDRILMLHIADKYRNEPIGRYAKWWTKHVNTSTNFPDSTDHQWDHFDFLLTDDTIQETDFRPLLSKYWFSPSNGLVFSRRGWDDNDSVVIMSSQDRIQLHGHGSQNEIMIYSGRGGSESDDCWVVGNRCGHGPSGENQNADWESRQHSTYRIAGYEQRMSKGAFYANDNLPTGNIDKTSFVEDVYVYAQGNASDAYRLGVSGFNSTIDPVKKSVDVYLREFVDLPSPGITIIYDRVKLRATTPDGTPVPQTCQGHFHYPKPQPVVNGDVATISVGTAKIYRKHLLPFNQASTFIDETTESAAPISYPYNCFDEQIDYAVSGNYSRAMVAFETESNASPGISPISKWDFLASADYEGATIDKAGVRYHVGFTKNQTGAEPTNPFNYNVGKTNNNDIHIITGLVPLQRYFVDETTSPVIPGANKYQFTKAQIGFPADDAGVVMFTPAQLGDQSTAFISVHDNCSTNEVINSVTDTATSLLDSSTSVERTTLITTTQAVIQLLDSCTTAEVTNLKPLLNGGIFDSVSSKETIIMIADTVPQQPTFPWSEKTIKVTTSPMFPASDRNVSFFGPDPFDGSIFDKLADSSDSTFAYTFGAVATNAFIEMGLTRPGDFVGRIRLIQPIVRVLQCEIGGSSNVTITFAIAGLGLTILAQTTKTKALFHATEPVDIVFDPIPVNIEAAKFADMGMSIDISGTPIGAGFLLKLSRAYVNVLSATSSEKVIQ